MRHIPTLLLLASVVLSGCSRAARDDAAAEVAEAGVDTLPALAALSGLTAAATWTGTADGDAPSTVTLFPDGTFRQRTVSGDASGPVVSHGRFNVARREARVTLWGGRTGPQRFALRDPDTWRPLDSRGSERAAGAASAWRRAAVVDPITDAARLSGAFVYFADAAIFTECVSGKQYPVAMEGAYAELERRYGASPAAGGSPAVVQVRARIGEAPAAEGDGHMTAVIVEQVEGVGTDGDCEALATRRALDGSEFTLVELEGAALDPAGGRGAPSLQMEVGESRLAGSDGCNRFTGRGVLRGVDLLAVGPLAGTRMMCTADGVMERATRYTRLLAEGGWFRLSGDTLVLSSGPRVMARFARTAPAQR